MRVSLVLAVSGLLLLSLFQENYESADLASLERSCSGKVSLDSEVKSAFFTKSGSYAVSLSKGVFALLKSEAAFRGDRIIVRGRAQGSGGNCWIFADSFRVL